MQTCNNQVEPKAPRRPLSPWELPSLMTPMHTYRRARKKRPVERPHFARILAFVHRNRFAVASLIQRRFADVLRSDRTARRHLEEMEALGYLGVAPARGVSPLFPKVYYVAGRGVRRLRDCLAAQGKSWKATRVDRRGRHAREGYGAEQLVHEIFITEFLLSVWQMGESDSNVKVLTMQRRSLAKHPAFQFTMAGRTTQLIPDAMFLVRHNPGGMACYFVEMDNGSMNRKQLQAKFQRYVGWSKSAAGQQYLVDLYRRHGATDPRPVFRLLVVVKSRTITDDQRRFAEIAAVVKRLPGPIRNRLWLTTVTRIQANHDTEGVFASSLWQVGGARTTFSISRFVKVSSRSSRTLWAVGCSRIRRWINPRCRLNAGPPSDAILSILKT